MKILIACVSSSATPDGVCRHAINLVAALLEHPEIDKVHLVAGRWQLAFIHSLLGQHAARCHLVAAECFNSSSARNLWYLRSLPRLAHELQADLVHLAYPVPVRKAGFRCPVVTTLHDLYPTDAPHNFGFPRVLLNRFILRQCLYAVDAIACVSNSTLVRLRTYNVRAAAKAVHISNCIRPIHSSASAPDLRLEHQPFLLAVAQHRHNKNLQLTLDAFRCISRIRPDVLLVIVGNKGPETPALYKLLDDEQLRARVLLLHGISDEELQWCYHHSRLLLATSSVEGFGLPIAEAMLAGCAVVCSDIPPFREIGDMYCRFVSSDSSASVFAEAVQQTLTLPRPAPQPLRHLRPSAVVDQYLRLYRALLAKRHRALELLTLPAQKDVAL